jgi:hypothetical protein
MTPLSQTLKIVEEKIVRRLDFKFLEEIKGLLPYQNIYF